MDRVLANIDMMYAYIIQVTLNECGAYRICQRSRSSHYSNGKDTTVMPKVQVGQITSFLSYTLKIHQTLIDYIEGCLLFCGTERLRFRKMPSYFAELIKMTHNSFPV